MIKIIHLSDLHFGTEYPERVQKLLIDINHAAPDIIVISGDSTQRATKEQFQRVKKFLEALPKPILCVPGNHDIPLYNLFVRLLAPFYKYKKFISPDLCIHLNFKNIAILGINSVTPYKPMGGYVTKKQLQLVTDYFQLQPKDAIKIVVMHHNLIRSERHKIINDSESIITLFAKCNVNLVLSGHIHLPHIELLKRNYLSHNMYVITAGTAVSNRTMVPNSYNIIQLEQNQFKLIVRDYIDDKFVTARAEIYPL